MSGIDQPPRRELRQRAVDRLQSTQRSALQKLRVETFGNAVVLRGSVPSYYDQQLAIHCCQLVDGVGEIRSEVEVHSDVRNGR